MSVYWTCSLSFVSQMNTEMFELIKPQSAYKIIKMHRIQLSPTYDEVWTDYNWSSNDNRQRTRIYLLDRILSWEMFRMYLKYYFVEQNVWIFLYWFIKYITSLAYEHVHRSMWATTATNEHEEPLLHILACQNNWRWFQPLLWWQISKYRNTFNRVHYSISTTTKYSMCTKNVCTLPYSYIHVINILIVCNT